MITIDGDKLTLAINVMKTFAPEGWMFFEEKNLYFRAVDTANVGLVECKVAATITDPLEPLGLPFVDFPTGNSGTIQIETTKQLFTIHAGRVNYKVKPILGVTKPPTPTIPWTNIFKMKPADLKLGLSEVCGAYAKKDTRTAVRITYNKDGLVIEDMDRELVDVTYKRDELTIQKEETPEISLLMPTDYMKAIAGVIGNLNEAIIGIGPDMPMTISANSSGLGCGWIIAYRVDV